MKLMNRMRRVGAAAGVAVAAVFAATPSAMAQESVPLRYKWEQGQVLRQRVTQETNSTGDGPMGAMSSKQKQVMTVRTTVQSVAEDGAATLEYVTEAMQVEMEMPMQGKVTYDTAKPEQGDGNHPAVQAMTTMLNEPIVFVMGPDGKIREVRGIEKLKEKMRKSLEGTPGGEMAGAQVEQMFTEEQVKQMFGQSAAALPARDTKVGETWQSVIEIPMPMIGKLKSTSDFTLKGVEKMNGAPAARIDVAMTMAQVPLKEGEQPAGMFPGMTASIKDGKGTGEMWFDHARGQMLKYVLNSSMTMDINVDAGGQKMKMSQKVDSKTTVEQVDDKAVDTPKTGAAPAK